MVVISDEQGWNMSIPSNSHSLNAPAGTPNIAKAHRFTRMFDSIDTSGSGSITETQFDQAFANVDLTSGQTITKVANVTLPKPFGQSAPAVWSQIDPTNTGTLTEQQFVTGMNSLLINIRAQAQQATSAASSTSQAIQQISAGANTAIVAAGSMINKHS
jgi:hypothetical protein